MCLAFFLPQIQVPIRTRLLQIRYFFWRNLYSNLRIKIYYMSTYLQFIVYAIHLCTCVSCVYVLYYCYYCIRCRIMGSYLSHSANIVIHGQCCLADTLLITSVFDSTVKYAIWGRVGDRKNRKRQDEREMEKKTVALWRFLSAVSIYVYRI